MWYTYKKHPQTNWFLFTIKIFLFVLTITAAGFSHPTSADTLFEKIDALLKTHKRITAAEADLLGAQERAKVAFGDWFPKVDLTANYGYELQQKGQGSDDTSMPPRNVELSLNQLLWDFGSTHASIQRARLEVEQSKLALRSAQQSVLLEAIVGYMEVLRQSRILEFAKGSVANIKHQADLENSKVQRGSGIATDVLQAKTQLAGAEAMSVQAEGALQNSKNRYNAIFGQFPKTPRKMKRPRIPIAFLPSTLEEAIEIAFKENPQLMASAVSSRIAQIDLKKTKADGFGPKINASLDKKWKQDDGGTIGGKQETLAKVELTYSFDVWLTNVNTIRAAQQTLSASKIRYDDTQTLIEEQVRNAWENLRTSRLNAERLQNQANIAAEFLALARKERQLGNRSLIDVLAGETALISAQSDAASAETDITLATFRLLSTIGRLNVDSFKG